MRYSINGEFYRAIRITGPTHNLLGLSFCQGVPETVAVEPLEDQSERGLDESLLRQAVLAGVARANAACGTDYQVARIQYVPTDTPNPKVYSLLAQMIVERLASGARFDGDGYDGEPVRDGERAQSRS